MFAASLLSLILLTNSAVAAGPKDTVPLLASPRPDGAPLVVQELHACQDARLALGIPLEAPSGTLSDIVRIDVVASIRLSRPFGLIYSLRNGREFFGLASNVTKDPATLEGADDFLRGATFGAHPSGVDLANDGYSVDPIIIDNRRLPSLGIERVNCASIRIL